MTQEDLAHAAGIHVTYLSGIERGHRNPSWSKVGRLAAALGIDTSDLVRRTETHASREEAAGL
jgi:transcriptional regulator with XRE-family HTH domain